MKTNNNENASSQNTDKDFYPFINKDQRKLNEKAVIRLIDMLRKWFLYQRTQEVFEYMNNLKYIGSIGEVKLVTNVEIIQKCLLVVAESEVDQNNSMEHGTAMFPKYNNVWNIGVLGSIWLDIKIDNKCYRLGFYNENPPALYVQDDSPSFLTIYNP